MKKLILIRHAETDYTYQRKYCGHTDIPLNAKGIHQANRIRLKLKNIKVDRVYSSDLKRAYETAKIVFRNKTVFKRTGLREIDFGKFAGLTWEEVSKSHPTIYKMWLSNPASTKIPEGEGMPSFTKRVENCFKKIAAQNSEKIVALVSHGGPIRIILLKILNYDLGRFWNIEQNVAAINLIEFEDAKPRVLKINDVSCLEQ